MSREAYVHQPVELRKVAPGYRDDEGRDHPAQLLRRYECSCGWKGSCWYASKECAYGHFNHHLNQSGTT
jgi:hypothetical protein